MTQKPQQPKNLAWVVALVVVVLFVLNTSTIVNAQDEEQKEECKKAVNNIVLFVTPFLEDSIRDPKGAHKAFTESLEAAKTPAPTETMELILKYAKCVPNLGPTELTKCTEDFIKVSNAIRNAQEKVKDTSLTEDARDEIVDDASKSIQAQIKTLLKTCKLPHN